MSVERKYTVREVLHLLADVVADSIEVPAAANDVVRDIKPVNAAPRPKRPRVPRRSASTLAGSASETDKAVAREELRRMGVHLK